MAKAQKTSDAEITQLVRAAFRAIQEMEEWDEIEVELSDQYEPVRIDLSLGIKVLRDALTAMRAQDE